MQISQLFKVGDSVKVKAELEDPDAYDYDITNWQGRIFEISKDKESGDTPACPMG